MPTNSGPPAKKLSSRQETALVALLTHPTYQAASQACGVPERTLRFWLRDVPAFGKEYRTRRREAYDQAVALAERLLVSAILVLHRNMNCGHRPAENKAATALVSVVVKGMEFGDLAQRVAELEQLVEERIAKKGRKKP